MTRTNTSIICLNCFGIPVPVHRKERFELIAQELCKLSPDIIALQEVFVWTDRNRLIEKLNDKYNVYPDKFMPFSSGGLITFIKKDIMVNHFKFSKFKNQGNKTLISIPDGIAGKGYQILELKIDEKVINFVNCHMLCQYNRTEILKKSYLDQIEELIMTTSKLGAMTILTGDLNDDPDSVGIVKLKKSAYLNEKLSINDYTVDPKNLNRGKIMNIFSDGNSYRTDYLLTTKEINILNQSIIFKDPIELNSKKYHLSDHYGILTKLKI